MQLVSAMCPNCGGKLDLDQNMEKGFCMYCGSQIIVQDAVQRYKIEISGKVSVEGVLTADDLAANGDKLLEIGNPSQAEKNYKELTIKYPGDYRGWWGLTRIETWDFTLAPENHSTLREEQRQAAERYFSFAYKTAPANVVDNLVKKFDTWHEVFCKRAEIAAANRSHEEHIASLRQEYEMQKIEIQEAKGSHRACTIDIVKAIPMLVIRLILFLILLACNFFFITSLVAAIIALSKEVEYKSLSNVLFYGIIEIPFLILTIKNFISLFFGKFAEFFGDITTASYNTKCKRASEQRMSEINQELAKHSEPPCK